ncbi:hypothetical protein [Sulfuracidifex tepidarius]|uniref:Uncharacterized protein n=1 Tax=Sulfuracidifex tepidarius TaxID=1294262 RepID=A0A510DVG6_9CREN|nr:hypothetical protein [Sulfuracidifex tepidarius]BBG23968.1 hypothetical protein IC006_1268 [Sulfuracidifex tepidarius]BBG26723.1 hypothetical protein IC007_1243 [Sulfuracidifex tepidarius]
MCIEQKWGLFSRKSYATYVPAVLVSYTINKATYNQLATGDVQQSNSSLLKKPAKQGIVVFS